MERPPSPRSARRAAPLAPGDVLVALEHAAEARRVLPVAVTLARRLGAGVRLVHVVPAAFDVATGWGAAVEDPAEGLVPLGPTDLRIAEVAARLRESTRLRVTATTDWGDDVVGRLVALAQRHDAAAIVVRTRGRPWLARALLGSVTARLVEECPVPVVVVPPECQPPADTTPWSVLVALDGTPESERAAESLGALAASRGAHLVLARIVAPGRGEPSRDAAHALGERLRARGWSASDVVCIADDAFEGIAAAAAAHAASLVVAASTWWGMRPARSLARVAHALARAAGPPLWVVTPPMLGARAAD